MDLEEAMALACCDGTQEAASSKFEDSALSSSPAASLERAMDMACCDEQPSDLDLEGAMDMACCDEPQEAVACKIEEIPGSQATTDAGQISDEEAEPIPPGLLPLMIILCISSTTSHMRPPLAFGTT